jgi:hypothetical protein
MATGFSHWLSDHDPLNLRRATQIGLGLLVLVMAVLSLVASSTAIRRVVSDNPGALLSHVDRESAARGPWGRRSRTFADQIVRWLGALDDGQPPP